MKNRKENKIMANKQTVLTYTEKELAAIEALRANAGEHLTLKELGIAAGTMTSIRNKAKKVAEGVLEVGEQPVINVNVEDYEDICPTCGAKHSGKKFYL